MHSSWILTLKVILISQIFEGESQYVCPGFVYSEEGQNDLSPKMQISKLASHAFSELGVGGDTIVINSNFTTITEFQLDCWAPYPIDFTFKGHLNNQRIDKVRTKVSGCHSRARDSKNCCYHINVTLPTYKEITGNYSCFSISNPEKLKSSKYIYYTPRNSILLRNGTNARVQLYSPNETIIFPCAVSDPEYENLVELCRLEGNVSVKMDKDENLGFDPKIGFELKQLKVMEKPVQYQCRLLTSETVNITVIPAPDWIVHPRILRIDINQQQGDRLDFECASKSFNVTIEANPAIPQDLYDVPMNNTSAHLGKYIPSYPHFAWLRTKSLDNVSQTGEVKCINNSSGKVLHRWNYKVLSENVKAGTLQKTNLRNFCSGNSNSNLGKENGIIQFECDNWVACRMSLCHNRNDVSPCAPSHICRNDICIDNGIIQCPTLDGGMRAEIFFTGFNNVKYVDWRTAKPGDILRLIPKALFEDLNRVELQCEGTNFVFAGGFQWTLNFKNGTNITLQESLLQLRPKERWGERKSTILSTIEFSLQKNNNPFIDQETGHDILSSFTCSAPVWNSTEWLGQTIMLQGINNTIIEHQKKMNATRIASNAKSSAFVIGENFRMWRHALMSIWLISIAFFFFP